ncbi:DegT/DnrJ/EryC1/StrS family aminotransferase [bacterium]|nr:DegT/DnrJ/EryC1/StrS family aminotransferase [bacterium]
MKIDFANLQKQYQAHKEEIDQAIHQVLDQSNYIMGAPVIELEDDLRVFTQAKHVVTCSSGTDALLLSLMALNIEVGDEIITTPFTFIATVEVIVRLGATPVFVDIDEDSYNLDSKKIEDKITNKTKVIIPVSLFGSPCDMDAINALAQKYGLVVIEDAAQSFGATYKDHYSCNLSTLACTSFFPAKPLGCFGDGGAIFTECEEKAKFLQSMRVHGQQKRYHHDLLGIGGRLDTIQAAILRVKLKYFKDDLSSRRKIAKKYDQLLHKTVKTPFVTHHVESTYAQYSIQVNQREDLQAALKKLGIPTAIHYPISLHLQKVFQSLGYKKGDFPISELVAKNILSLPINPYLTDEETGFITDSILQNI